MDNKLLVDVVMLPTDFPRTFSQHPYLRKGMITGIIRFETSPWMDDSIKAQHLYLISSREIKESDWFIYDSIITNTGKINLPMSTPKYRIEATTDPSLGLPLIPTKWIEEVYVPSQGKIKQVCLKSNDQGKIPDCYDEQQWREEDYDTKKKCLQWSPTLEGRGGERHVIILPIKDSWNREELKKALKEIWENANTSLLINKQVNIPMQGLLVV